MATSTYMIGRKKWSRPQGLLLSNNPGTLSNGLFVPQGDEGQDFIVLSDHNRQPFSISQQRIENRQRMVNGTMRSYHTADKLSLSVSWNRLPSRSFSTDVEFDEFGKPIIPANQEEFAMDGGAGGVSLLEWYQDHAGPFYVFLSYDKYINFNTDPFDHLNQYNQILHMYFASFEYTVEKRGANNYDMWNISLTLEEV